MTQSAEDQPLPEFSRPVAVARLVQVPAHYDIEAKGTECEALARRLGLLSVERLSAAVSLRRARAGTYELSAAFEASVVQRCVVTLEPFPVEIHETFTLTYREASSSAAASDEIDEEFELVANEQIDIGEAVTQELSLSLDPYPHAPGASTDELYREC